MHSRRVIVTATCFVAVAALAFSACATRSTLGAALGDEKPKQETQDPAKVQHTKDSVETLKKNMKEKKAILLDVREQKEWDAGHLADARLLPLSKLREMSDEQLAKALPKDKIVYAHCRSGGRCLTAAELLRKRGYDVRALKPGYEDLLKGGLDKAKKQE